MLCRGEPFYFHHILFSFQYSIVGMVYGLWASTLCGVVRSSTLLLARLSHLRGRYVVWAPCEEWCSPL